VGIIEAKWIGTISNFIAHCTMLTMCAE
jgi:hypothetical protein